MQETTSAPAALTRFWSYAAAWLLLALLHLTLLVNCPRSALDTYGLMRIEQIALAAVEPLLLAGLIALLALARIAAGRWQLDQRMPRWLLLSAKTAGVMALVSATIFYTLSWAMFRSLGSFLGEEGLRFAAANPKLLLQHFLEINLAGWAAGLVLGSGALVAVVTYGPERIGTVRPATKLGLVQATVAAVTLLGALSLTSAGLLWLNRNETRVNAGLPMPAAALAEGTLATRSGPLAHVLMTWLAPLRIMPVEVAGTSGPKRAAGKDYAAQLKATARPNVIVIVIEALRDDAWRQTSPEPVMPNLLALARASVVFDRAYSHANHSDYAAPCVVSSQYPLRERHHHYYPADPPYPRVMLYDVLKGLGYRTAIVSSQNEHWGEMSSFLSTPGLDLLFHSETFQDKARTVVDAEDVGFVRWTSNFGRSGKIDDGDTMSEAIAWTARGGEPFFLSMNLQNSHFPYRFPPEHDRFRPSKVDFPYTFNNYPLEKNHVVKNRYLNALHYADAQLGRLLAALGPKLANTILVVTGDHGEAFFEHGFGQHGSELYEETLRVPLVMHLPGQEPRAVSGVASHVDVPPTVLSAMGLPAHPAMQGHDLLQPIPEHRASYATVQTPIRWDIAIITQRYKLITNGALQQPRLTDLQQDPKELTNLATSRPELLDEMRRRLRTYRDVQLIYYHDPARMRDEYPPRIE